MDDDCRVHDPKQHLAARQVRQPTLAELEAKLKQAKADQAQAEAELSQQAEQQQANREQLISALAAVLQSLVYVIPNPDRSVRADVMLPHVQGLLSPIVGDIDAELLESAVSKIGRVYKDGRNVWLYPPVDAYWPTRFGQSV